MDMDEKFSRTEMLVGNEGMKKLNDSKVAVYMIPTNEELVIARDTMHIVSELEKQRKVYGKFYY